MPIAVVAQLCDIAAPIVNTFFAHQADRFANQENYRGIDLCIWGGGIVYFLFKFVPIFLGYVLGSGVITSFVDQIPPVIQEGLNQSGNLLPALGVAMLIQLTWDKKFGVFLFLGFALAAFLNVSTLGAAFFGAIAAVIYYMLSGKQAPAAALETQGAASEPIDDEDDGGAVTMAEEKKLSQKTLRHVFNRHYQLLGCFNYERQMSTGYAYTMMPGAEGALQGRPGGSEGGRQAPSRVL